MILSGATAEAQAKTIPHSVEQVRQDGVALSPFRRRCFGRGCTVCLAHLVP